MFEGLHVKIKAKYAVICIEKILLLNSLIGYKMYDRVSIVVNKLVSTKFCIYVLIIIEIYI